MSAPERYDVVIAGGGLAGLCLAIQLERRAPGLRVLVAEKDRHPPPEAAHKVGESSVEVASHYFSHVLGLADVLAGETPKFGLRFFLSQGSNRDIALRPECGPSHFLWVESFQIDRGRFEKALALRARELGAGFLDGCRVAGVVLGSDGEDHRITLESDGAPRELRCRWLVDASGRAGLLKRQLGLSRGNRHDANAAWFRIDGVIDPDDWSRDSAWRGRVEHPRRLSTNHLMGKGYWVWLIPLAQGRTSVGIVADAKLHPFASIRSFERAMAWLDVHEPQLAEVLRAHPGRRMDFRALKGYSHDARQLFSADRWCLVGDAGAFLDPFYSPGSDFIAIANGFVCDLVTRERRGEDVRELARSHDRIYRSLVRTYLVTYLRQYPLMGSPRIMGVKIVWDFAMYWGGIAPLFFRDKLCDPSFMERVRPLLRGFATTNIGMQAFFRDWARAAPGAAVAPRSFVDYAELGFLADLNRDLLRERDDDDLLKKLSVNLELARELEQEIFAEGARIAPEAARPGTHATTAYLAPVFAALGE